MWARADRLLLATPVAAAHSWITGTVPMHRAAAGALGQVTIHTCCSFRIEEPDAERTDTMYAVSQRAWPRPASAAALRAGADQALSIQV